MALELFEHLYIPGTSDVTLVLFHGDDSDKEGMATFGRNLAPDAGLLALDGQVADREFRRFFKNLTHGFYDMQDLDARTRDVAAFLNAAFDKYSIDPAKTLGLGCSNGASILVNLILTGRNVMPHCVAMRPLIPFMVEDWPDLSNQSLLITASEHDADCPAPWTYKLADGLREAGADVTLKMHSGGRDMNETEISFAQNFMSERPQAAI